MDLREIQGFKEKFHAILKLQAHSELNRKSKYFYTWHEEGARLPECWHEGHDPTPHYWSKGQWDWMAKGDIAIAYHRFYLPISACSARVKVMLKGEVAQRASASACVLHPLPEYVPFNFRGTEGKSHGSPGSSGGLVSVEFSGTLEGLCRDGVRLLWKSGVETEQRLDYPKVELED
ncbi:uncharacterized protein EDB91DRAFT_1087620 [Suillus paluster]|uniref:uncharacterized protein n=1 Tax=Suillus paluster TaxID=48578 RepID=UPI001B87223E|nr:uncharacterized protein EDB91DRAFT_1087620 [Suillus paluster]KAG1724054.1 hypothetical protein EDB91DRAFT_1087620 [Suillus paluster]